ncbi:hypothetical protein E3O42_08920 [Cryobacterium adonitolivorans]|uniref:DUF222 domain-containing protein n=1 Tax=Cryobacterium adonitolivorans TaxID=1259189 RepID=A0A4R8W7C2_9MICO|nr:hypothetical protein [Cryobacterium adonitolivorans]TFC02085.1 hypothetical protein E3O42_08920 [Cryobacterium adonitolivorans]
MPTVADVSAPEPEHDTPAATVPGRLSGDNASADALALAVEAVEGWGACSPDYDALSNAEALTGQCHLARLRNLVETRSVWMAKTLAYRSRPELGQKGLAQPQGFLAPEALVQKMTGATKTDARKLVDVGRKLALTEAAEAEAAAAHGAAEAGEADEADEAAPRSTRTTCWAGANPPCASSRPSPRHNASP